jgi:hypothetical protein
MNNVNFVTLSDGFGNEYIHAIIENADGGFTSMPKSVYDAMQTEVTQ